MHLGNSKQIVLLVWFRIDAYTSFFMFSAYFEIKQEVETILDNLIPYLTIVGDDTKSQMKTRETFNQTSPFDTSLPFLSMFFLRPSVSNLLMSPEINVRHVACDSFDVVPEGHKKSLKDMLYLEDDRSKQTFASRQLILYPYKVEKKNKSGVPLKSVSSYKVKHGNNIMQNTIVEMGNAVATNISDQDFKRVMALFGVSIDGRPNVYNFTTLLDNPSTMTDSMTLNKMITDLGFPPKLINLDHRFEVNMRSLGSFIAFSTPIHFGAPEGQTRLEAVSRPCFGYPLFGTAPLTDTDGPSLHDFDQDTFFAACKSLPIGSTAFIKVQGSVLYSADDKPLDSSMLQKLQDISQEVQEMGNLEVNTTYQAFYSGVIQDITVAFRENLGPLTASQWSKFNVSKKKKDEGDTNEEIKLQNLNDLLQTTLVRKAFHTRPCNQDLPKINDVQLTDEEFQTSISGDDKENWFTFKPFYHCWQNKMKLDTESGLEKGYFLLSGINTKLYHTPSVDKLMKSWSTSPAPTLLFDMMFTVVSNQDLLASFNNYIRKFPGTSHYYDPVWLAVYVFYPITTISTFCKDYYFKEIFEHEITKAMNGKCAPAKQKLMITIKTILLQEYFNTLILFGEKDTFNDLETYKCFSKAQLDDLNSTNGSGLQKRRYTAKDFLEMVLLTLPEKLHDRICLDKTNKFIPFKTCNFHWKTGIHLKNTEGRSLDNINDSGHLDRMPTIQDLLPSDIIPATIMQDTDLATAYTTKCLTSLQTGPPETPKKKRAAALSSPQSGSTKKAKKTATSGDETYIPPAPAQANKQTESTTSAKQHQPEVSNEVLQKKILLLQKVYNGMNTQIQEKKISPLISGYNMTTLLHFLHLSMDLTGQTFKPSKLFKNSKLFLTKRNLLVLLNYSFRV